MELNGSLPADGASSSPTTADDVRSFFDGWAALHLTADHVLGGGGFTPLMAVTMLRADAGRAGFSEDELQGGLGDLFEAVLHATFNLTAASPHAGADAASTPVQAMRIALNYLAGVHDTAGLNVELATDLILYKLTEQGFMLRPLPAGAVENAAPEAATTVRAVIPRG